MGEYRYKSEPFDHQRIAFEESRDLDRYALWWEMGTGKSKVMIDTAAYLYQQGKISGLIILAPNGVHRNWVVDEFEAHMPDEVYRDCLPHVWQSSSARTQRHQAAVSSLLRHRGLAVLAMNYDALLTEPARMAAQKFLDGRSCMLVADESSRVKSPAAKRTRATLALAKRARYRRILTGTPVANSPFDLYSQVQVLDPEFWKYHRLHPFVCFKAEFGVFEKRYIGGRSFDQLVSYKCLDRLQHILREVGSRVTKDEVLDLPPKLYTRRYVQMGLEQASAYKSMREQSIALVSTGEYITAQIALTQMLRLAQITSGWLPTTTVVAPAGEVSVTPNAPFPGPNPRLEALREVCDEVADKAIIWARFRHDVDSIVGALGDSAVRYDGMCNAQDRIRAIQEFCHGEARFFVANPAAAGEGLTLHAGGRCRTVVYYNNTFRLTDRLQSEDRAHRIGQPHPVQYIDLIVPGTVDEQVLCALRDKRDIASQVTGDGLANWI